MKNLSISIKLSIVIGCILLLTIVVTTLLSTIANTKVSVDKAETEMLLTLGNSVEKIQGVINENIKEMETHWRDLKSMKDKEGFVRTNTHDFYRSILEEEKSAIGYTVTVKPGRFDGKAKEYQGYPGYHDDGRYNEYYYKEDGKVLRDDITTSFEGGLEEFGSDWWRLPEKLKTNLVYMDIYNTGGKDVLMLSVTYTILENGEFIGVVCKDFISEFIQEEALLAKDKLFDGRCKITLFDNDGNIAADTEDKTNIGKELKDIDPDNYTKILASIKAGEEENIQEGNMYYAVVPIQFIGTPSKWQMRVEIPGKVIKEDARAQMWKQLIIGLFAILISIIILFTLTKYMLKPLRDLSTFSQYIANGDLTQNMDVKGEDEIGVVASAFNRMSKQLSETVAVIVNNAANIAQGSNQISSTSQQLSEGANEQASSIEEVSSTMEEMTANIQSNTDNAQQTESISKEANDGIKEVEKKSNDTADANKVITEKITIINDIAFQTNILALNAAVEAARAGEHGKGFAVVAAEVRKLAERSKVAADEIVGLAEKGLLYAQGAGDLMNQTIPKIENTTKLIQEISASSIEQNNGAGQVNSAIQQLNTLSQQNASASEELASSAEELSSQADELKSAVSFFKINNAVAFEAVDNTDKPFAKKDTGIENKKLDLTEGKKIILSDKAENDADFESF